MASLVTITPLQDFITNSSPLIIRPLARQQVETSEEKQGSISRPGTGLDRWQIEKTQKRLRDKIIENDSNLRQAFSAFDTKKDGFINISDLQRILSSFCFPISNQVFGTLLDMWDLKANHKIPYDQFLKKFHVKEGSGYALPHKDTHYYNPIRGDDGKLASEDIFQLIKKMVASNHGSLKASFLKLDDNKDGHLNWKEFRKALECFPVHIANSEFLNLMKVIDPHKRKRISYHEFLNMFEVRETEDGHPWLNGSHIPKHSIPPAAMTQTMVEKILRDKIQDNWATFTKAFTQADLNKDGFISQSELAMLLKKYTLPISKEHFNKMWEKCDENNDGKVQFSEFMNNLGLNIYADDLDGFSKRIHEESDIKIKSNQINQEERSQLEKTRQENLTSAKTVKEVYETLKGFVLQRSSNFRRTFLKFDLDGDSKISKKEFRSLLRKIDIHLSDESFKELLTRFTFINGKMSYLDFLHVFQDTKLCDGQNIIRKPNHRYHKVIEGNNKLSPEEMLKLLNKKIEEHSISIRQAFQQADHNNDGHVNKSEFHRLINKFMMHLDNEQFENLMEVLEVEKGNKIDYHKFLEKFERQENLKVGHPWLFTEYRFNDSRPPLNVNATTAFRMLAEKATDQWIDLATAYRSFDRDQSNWVSKKELKRILDSFNIPIGNEEFAKLWTRFDTDKNGKIDHSEFLYKLGSELAPGDSKGFSTKIQSENILEIQKHEKRQKSKSDKLDAHQKTSTRFMSAIEVENRLKDKFRDGYENLRKAFLNFDRNKDGFVSKEEFRKILQNFHYYINEEELQKLLFRVGLHFSDQISYTEFLNAFESNKSIYVSKTGQDFSNDVQIKMKNGQNLRDDEITDIIRRKINKNTIILLKAFKSFDVLNNDFIHQDNVHNVINSFCLQITKQQFKEFMLTHDIPWKDYINYKDVLIAVKNPISTISQKRLNKLIENTEDAPPEGNRRSLSPRILPAMKPNEIVKSSKSSENIRKVEKLSPPMKSAVSPRTSVEFRHKISQSRLSKSLDENQLSLDTDTKKNKTSSPSFTINRKKPSEKFNFSLQLATVMDKLDKRINQHIKPLRRQFRYLDKIGSGLVTLKNFGDILHGCNITLSTEDTYQIFSYFDRQLTGNISYNEFLKHFY